MDKPIYQWQNMMIGVLWQFHGSFLEVSWNCPYLAPMGLYLGAGAASEVVSSTCTFGRQAFEPIAPEFLTCTTSALLGERIGWMSHDASRVPNSVANLGERARKPIE